MIPSGQSEPVHHLTVLAGFEIHVVEWGVGNPETVVLWHGLARTSRDFDPLARVLAARWRVLAVDTIGRGLSQWARDPAADYCLAAYERLALDLLERFGVMVPRWIGTSMGGALGIRLAGGVLRDRISHLVVNDIGPELPEPAVERILTYVSAPPVFDTIAELEAWLRQVYAPYGFLPGGAVAADGADQRAPGRRRPDHAALRSANHGAVSATIPTIYDQWGAWQATTARTCLLRGADSDLLLPEVARRMSETGPRPAVREVAKTGHAPALKRAGTDRSDRGVPEGLTPPCAERWRAGRWTVARRAGPPRPAVGQRAVGRSPFGKGASGAVRQRHQ